MKTENERNESTAESGVDSSDLLAVLKSQPRYNKVNFREEFGCDFMEVDEFGEFLRFDDLMSAIEDLISANH